MISWLLVTHAVFAAVLLGAITHQTVSACWPSRTKRGFVSSFRAVSAATYTNAIITLYLVQTLLGSVIYPAYRLAVRPYLESARLSSYNGSFELKEQFIAIGLGMLPMYWLVWREPLSPER